MQRSLFDTNPAPWETDAPPCVVASVLFAKGPAGPFDYLVPEALRDERKPETYLEPGRRVRVPFGRGNRTVVGYCVEVTTKQVDAKKLKTAQTVVDSQSLINPAMLRLTRWMADYYLSSWGQVLEAVVPAGVRTRAGTRQMVLLSVPTRVAARLTQLKLTDKQRKVLETLVGSPKPLSTKQLANRAGCTPAPISTLRKQGLIEAHTERLQTSTLTEPPVERESPKQLNADQQQALDTIAAALDSRTNQTVLLHGVTGSGKTEVYIQAIEKVVSFGRQAIVLVPEISLTPQTVGRFRARFDQIAVLHSHQSDVERHQAWGRIARGEAPVVVGARSAVFAPTPRLGLIVIDEEHETTFKQDSPPRYHAREVALERARDEQVPVVLASATPSLEAWSKASAGDWTLVSMPKRVSDRPLPDVRIVDLREESQLRGGRGVGAISRPLQQAMDAALRDDGQVILLLNRRGFSTHVQCPSCGFKLECPHCEVAMTYHRDGAVTICHWCDHRQPPPRVCPDCGSSAIHYGGLGTQKLEMEVHRRFPKHECLRMDADTMRRPGSHEQALDRFRRGEASILLGTQMIAKGLDFPNVTVVGVISADTALSLPDFRAAERTFQLVTQVAGRTGRGDKGGRVLVQTYDPQHEAIAAAARHDYLRFANRELTQREATGFPPFGSLVRLIIRGAVEKTVEAFAEQLADRLRAAGGDELRIRGPAPAPVAKLRGDYRFHLLASAEESDTLRQATRTATTDLKPPDGVRWIADIDAVDML